MNGSMNGMDGYNTGNLAEAGGEPGAVENRLSLNPSDDKWPEVANWEDGETYIFTNVKVRQISAGEFEVLEATPGGEQEENPGADESGVAEEAEAPSGGVGNEGQYPNPAVRRMAMME